VRWRNVLIVAWVGLVLGAVGYLRLRRPDLAGGPVLVYEIDVDHAWEPGPVVAQQTLQAMMARIDRLASVAQVRRFGPRVEVRLPKGFNVGPLKRILAMPARIEFKIVDDNSSFMKALPIQDEYRGRDGWAEAESGVHHDDWYVRAPTVEALRAVFASAEVPADHEVAFERVESRDEQAMWRSYYLYRKAELTNADIEDVEVNWDPRTSRPEVSLGFTREAAQRFADLTGRSVGRKLAILLDGKIESAPVIESRIEGGRARITMGGFGDAIQLQQEAKDLVAVLRVGALPAPIRLVEER
jgi:preprotein translocase subunit SecD